MAWTLPDIPVASTVATVANWGAKVWNCLKFLKGLSGTVVLEDGLDLGANEFTVNSVEIVGADGEVNKAAVEDHTHTDTANCGTLDHGTALTGLSDEDHPAYIANSLVTEQGDIIYASGVSTPAALAHSTAGYILQSGGHGANPSWVTPTSAAQVKVKAETRNLAAATGDVSYTGYGFTPTGLIIFAYVANQGISIGNSDPALAAFCFYISGTETFYKAYIVYGLYSATAYQTAIVKSYDADGFTLTWTKTGTPAGTAPFTVFAFK